MALSLAATPPRLVPGSFFRVHLYVLLGLNALAAAMAFGSADRGTLWPALAAAVLSYVGSVIWIYEKHRAGRGALVLVAMTALVGAWLAVRQAAGPVTSSLGAAANQRLSWAAQWLAGLDPVASGLVLGTTMAAMLLGHWYLNTPSMKLGPLRRLVILMAVALLVRAVVSGAGLLCEMSLAGTPEATQRSLLALRWLAGVAGPLLLAWMTWKTLNIPNTQSATGILYVGVIATFLGELTSLLLSREAAFPL